MPGNATPKLVAEPAKPAAVIVDLPAPLAIPEPKLRLAEEAAFRNLQSMIADYGYQLISNWTQCEGLLSSRCVTKRERMVLVTALRENLPERLLKLPVTSLSKTAQRNLSVELSRATALNEAAAQFAVESWAKALGLQLQGA